MSWTGFRPAVVAAILTTAWLGSSRDGKGYPDPRVGSDRPLVFTGGIASKAPENPSHFRVLSFNLHGPPVRRIEALIEVLQTHPELRGASVLALQEVNRNHGESGDVAEVLARRLGMTYAFAVEMAYRRGGGVRGVAILSRFPMDAVERVLLPHAGPGGRRRIALAATLTVGSERMRVYSLHLETRIPDSRYADQLAAVLRHAAFSRALPTLLMGDFNTTTRSRRQRMSEMVSAEGFDLPQPQRGMTFRKLLIYFAKLDWICARDLRIAAAGVETQAGISDHRPVWADVVLPDREVDRKVPNGGAR
ncbi:MAG: endonuclease/exonuclease/phosphatase family protein [Acidobacteriota bacterium]